MERPVGAVGAVHQSTVLKLESVRAVADCISSKTVRDKKLRGVIHSEAPEARRSHWWTPRKRKEQRCICGKRDSIKNVGRVDDLLSYKLQIAIQGNKRTTSVLEVEITLV